MKAIGLIGIGLVLIPATLLFAQNTQPGARRDPGLFEGERKTTDDPNIRHLTGVVTDDQNNPVEGAVVKLKDTKASPPVIKSFLSQKDGSYRFSNLSTSVDYEVTAERGQMTSEKRKLGVFDSKKQAVINLVLDQKKKEDK
jgi:hypothetical protein